MSPETQTAIVSNVAIGLPFFIIGFLISPAFGYIARDPSLTVASIRQVMREALSATEHLFMRRSRVTQRRDSTTSDADRIVIGIVVAAGVIALYMKYRVPVLAAISAIAFLVAVAATISIVMMSRRGIVTGGHRITATLLLLYASSALGIVDVAFLWNPPAGGELFRQFVAAFATSQQLRGLEGMAFVAYQIIGAACYLLVAVLSIAFSIAIITALNIRAAAWGQPIWKFGYRFTSFTWSPWILGVAVLLGTVSVAASGGWLFHWLEQFSTVHTLIPTPATSPVRD
jgi:hypothetical protein